MAGAHAQSNTISNLQMTVLVADSTELCGIWADLRGFRKAMANQSRRARERGERAWVYEGQRPHHQRHSNEEQQGQRAGERRPKGQELHGSEGKEDDERHAVESHWPARSQSTRQISQIV
jgi:hypothetical protein